MTATEIPVYVDPCPGMKGTDTVRETCGRCSGKGDVNFGRQFYATEQGSRRVCYGCGGAGSFSRAVKNIRAAARRAHKAAVARVERDRAAAESAAQFRVDQPDLAARLAVVYDEAYGGAREDYARAAAAEKVHGEFLLKMANLAAHVGLTDAQATAAADALDHNEEKAAARAAHVATKRHHGERGTKATAHGTAVVAVTLDGHYGLSRLLVVEGHGDHEGVTFKTIGSGASLFDVDRGDVVTITGTVKTHEFRDDVPQTVLTRVKVTEGEVA